MIGRLAGTCLVTLLLATRMVVAREHAVIVEWRAAPGGDSQRASIGVSHAYRRGPLLV